MRKQIRKGLAILLTVVLVVGLLPVSAMAAGSEIQPGDRVIQSVAVGRDCGAVLTKGGAVWYWTGTNAPKKVIASGAKAIYGGHSATYMLALMEDDSLKAWGENSQGQLGIGTTQDAATPTQVLNMESGVVCADAGSVTSIGVKEDGTVWVWGRGSDYLVGTTTTGNKYAPRQASLGLQSAITTAVINDDNVLALDSGGVLWSWGSNSYGEYGNGTSGYATSNKRANRVNTPWEPAEVRSIHTFNRETRFNVSCVVTNEGAVWMWGGLNGSGEKVTIPQKMDLSNGNPVVQVEAGSKSFHALDENGTLWSYSPEGDGSTGNTVYAKPAAVLENVVTFSATPAYAGSRSALLAVTEDGTLWKRDNSQAAFYEIEGGWIEEYVPPLDPNPDPGLPEPENGVVSLSVGQDHAIALQKDGTLWGWGSNSSGQLGLESGAFDSLTPCKLMEDVAWADADSWYTMAVKTDGTLWGWGSNSYGQLGDGTNESSKTPKQIMDGVSRVYIDEQCTLILKQDNTLWACGNFQSSGVYGPNQVMEDVQQVWQDGDAFMVTDSDGALWSGSISGEPTRLVDSGVCFVAQGSYHNMAIQEDGTVWAWGSNTYGELGDGTTTQRPEPVNITKSNPALANMVAADCGTYNSSFLLRKDGYLWALGRYRWNDKVSTGTMQIMDGVKSAQMNTNQDNLVLKRDGTLLGWNRNGVSSSQYSYNLCNYNEPTVLLNGVYQVFFFDSQAYAVKSDGTLWAWGVNRSGILGDGTETNRTTPVQVVLEEATEPEPSEPVEVPVSRVAAGFDFSLAVKNDGTVWAWGSNSSGQLGNGTTSSYANYTKPAQVQGLDNVAAVTAGRDHSVAIQQGGVLWAWGENGSGQLGTNNSQDSYVPVRIMDGVVKAEAGPDYTMALKGDGTLWIWGSTGSMGYGNGKSSSYRPTQIMSDVKDFSAGSSAIAVVTNDGALVVWGARSAIGIKGSGFDYINDPVVEQATTVVSSGVESVSVGSDYIMYVTTAGDLYAKGSDHYGETGVGNIFGYETHYVTGGVKSVKAGIYTTLITKTDGTLWTCGMLDINAPISGLQRTPTKWRDGPVSDMDLSFGSTLDEQYGHGLLVQGDVLYTWGGNLVGQLGNGTYNYVASPRGIMYITDREVALAGRVEIGGNLKVGETLTAYTYDVATDLGGSAGTLSYQWYRNGAPIQGATKDTYTLKDEDAGGYFMVRVTASACPGELESQRVGPVLKTYKVKSVAAGSGYFLAVLEDGTLWAWGRNDGGQLGDGTRTERREPVKIMDGVAQVAAGTNFSMAIKTDGSLWSWGVNMCGQLGDGTNETRLTPVKVMDGVKQVALGSEFAIAVKTDGSLWTWGSSFFGELGDGQNKARNTPAQIRVATDGIIIKNVVDIAAGSFHGLARLSTGEVLGWGTSLAVNGQFYGSGYYPIPIPVLSGTMPTKTMAAGTNHSLYNVDVVGWTVVGYGSNNMGQLGDGTTLGAFSEPAFAKELTSVSKLLAGGNHSAAISLSGALYGWGENDCGQVGNGNTTNQTTPIIVMSNVQSAALSSSNSAAIKTDGTLWLWGDNSYGQLADGTTSPSYKPKELVFADEVETLPEDKTYDLLKNSKIVGQYTISYESAQTWALTAQLDSSKLEDPQAVEGATLYLAVCDDTSNPKKIWCGTFENGKARIGNIPVSYLEEGMREIFILDQRLIPLTSMA